jgi:hypothetical protein
MENAFAESLHRESCDKCLNTHYRERVPEGRRANEDWRCWCNTERRHSPLGYMSPAEYSTLRLIKLPLHGGGLQRDSRPRRRESNHDAVEAGEADVKTCSVWG